MATRIEERVAGSRTHGVTAWCVERDIAPGVVEFVRCGTRQEAEAELGGETPENAPWMLRSSARRRPDRWRL